MRERNWYVSWNWTRMYINETGMLVENEQECVWTKMLCLLNVSKNVQERNCYVCWNYKVCMRRKFVFFLNVGQNVRRWIWYVCWKWPRIYLIYLHIYTLCKNEICIFLENEHECTRMKPACLKWARICRKEICMLAEECIVMKRVYLLKVSKNVGERNWCVCWK